VWTQVFPSGLITNLYSTLFARFPFIDGGAASWHLECVVPSDPAVRPFAVTHVKSMRTIEPLVRWTLRLRAYLRVNGQVSADSPPPAAPALAEPTSGISPGGIPLRWTRPPRALAAAVIEAVASAAGTLVLSADASSFPASAPSPPPQADSAACPLLKRGDPPSDSTGEAAVPVASVSVALPTLECLLRQRDGPCSSALAARPRITLLDIEVSFGEFVWDERATEADKAAFIQLLEVHS